MKFILLLALVGCAVNVQVTAAAAVNTLYEPDDAKVQYAAANAARPSINAAAAAEMIGPCLPGKATCNNGQDIAAAAPFPVAAPLNAAVAKIPPSDYFTDGRRFGGNRFGSRRFGIRRHLYRGGHYRALTPDAIAKITPSDYSASKGHKRVIRKAKKKSGSRSRSSSRSSTRFTE